MDQQIEQHINSALMYYGQLNRRNHLLKAKEEYFSLAGSLNEDHEDYESKMKSFNHWFLFQNSNGNHPIIQEYLLKHDIDEEIKLSMKTVNYSLFELKKFNFKKNIVLNDMIHKKTIKLSGSNNDVALVVGDIFVDRTITYKKTNYLLGGPCVLPNEVRSILYKQARKVLKLKDKQKEVDFLLKLESLKNKWINYGHIEASKIFTFN